MQKAKGCSLLVFILNQWSKGNFSASCGFVFHFFIFHTTAIGIQMLTQTPLRSNFHLISSNKK
jgi:hypothetical protein